MGEAIRSLIIENDPETARQIDLLGRRIGSLDIRWSAGSVAEGAAIVRKFRPDMAIVAVNGNPADAIGPLAGEFPNLYILALSATHTAEYALEAMRAGAHDLLCKPMREVDLSIAIEKAQKAQVRREPAERRGKIVTVFSNKGGNGTTTIAVNLADALATDHGKRVVVVDLVLGHGDVTMFFNVSPTYTVLDLARNNGKADPEYIDSLIVRHASGVCILADPPRIE
ncbi:MAG: response regulator receiver protein [Deltaproteobacteria bacterium]|nr:response regulator receiver protein [Deltaproteobacteria bacterium]